MGCKVTVLCFCLVLATVRAIEVNITKAWKPYPTRWEFNCSWAIPPDDSLQLVRLYKNDQEIMIFNKPKDNGGRSLSVYGGVNGTVTHCAVPNDDRKMGTCVITQYQYNAFEQDFTISCEVSGESPYFRTKRKNAVVDRFTTVRAIEVNITKAWKPYTGWEINCSWAIPPDDSLDTVRLFKDYHQFMIYRPEADGGSSHIESRDVDEMRSTNCAVSTDDQQKGTCVITLELYRPLGRDFTISCEVSGGRPYFRTKRKTFVVDRFVPPSDAVITVGPLNETSGQVTLNCSASCVPTIPDLSWTIGDQKIPREFSGASWNTTTKLWHAWSVISYTPSSGSAAVCTPEISREGELLGKGHAAQYNAARDLKGGVFNTIITVISLLLLI